MQTWLFMVLFVSAPVSCLGYKTLSAKGTVEPTWELYEEKSFTKRTTNSKQDVNIKRLSELIFRSIKVYGMELTGIAELAKELTVDVGFLLTQDNDSRRIFRQQKCANGRNCFLIFKMEKHNTRSSNRIGTFFNCHTRQFVLNVDYVLLIPMNRAAERRCNEMMRDKIDVKLEGLVQTLNTWKQVSQNALNK